MKQKNLKKYVHERKKRDKAFAEGYDAGYEQFKIGSVRGNRSGRSDTSWGY